MNETWALPLFHDRFRLFATELNSEMIRHYSRDENLYQSIIESLQTGVDVFFFRVFIN